MLSLAAKIRACIIFSTRPSPPRLPPDRGAPTCGPLCPFLRESQYAAPAHDHLGIASNLSTPVSLPLDSFGIKIPLLRRSLLPSITVILGQVIGGLAASIPIQSHFCSHKFCSNYFDILLLFFLLSKSIILAMVILLNYVSFTLDVGSPILRFIVEEK